MNVLNATYIFSNGEDMFNIVEYEKEPAFKSAFIEIKKRSIKAEFMINIIQE